MVLLVDDDADFTEILSGLLRDEGQDVVIAATGHHALELARELGPAVAFVDVHLPDIHGITLAALLRAAVGSRSIRIIGMTGWPNEQKMQTAVDRELFDAWLRKSAAPSDFMAALGGA